MSCAPLLVFLLGLFVTVKLTRSVIDDPFLQRAILFAYLLKVVLACFLFFVSWNQLPFLSHYQIGSGFWSFSWDSVAYHQYGRHIVEALKSGAALEANGSDVPWSSWFMSIYMLVLYGLLGVQPLAVILLNSLYGTFTVILSFLLMKKLKIDKLSIRYGVLLIAFWPSLILWSTQILKDPISIMMILAEFYLLFSFWGTIHSQQRIQWVLVIPILLLTVLLTILRNYVGFVFLVTVFIVLGLGILLSGSKKKLRQFFCYGVLIAILALAVVLGDLSLGRISALRGILGREHGISSLVRSGPVYLGMVREGMVRESQIKANLVEGKTALMDSGVRFQTFGDLCAYLPRAFLLVFLSPFPWQWFPEGKFELLRFLSGGEVILIYILLGAFVFSLVRWRMREPNIYHILLWTDILFLAMAIGLTLPNVGTLFRVRLQLLIPLIIAMAAARSFPENSHSGFS